MTNFRDSTLSFFINQLDQFDRVLYEPLVNYTWGRDIKLRTDVSIASESTSFERSSFGGVGNFSANGMPFISQNSNTLANISIDGERVVTPVRPLGRMLSYTEIELRKSQKLSQPIDIQQINGLNTMYQMDIDQMVYVGNTSNLMSAYGLVNSPLVTVTNVVNGVSGFPQWTTKTADEILNDVNTLLQQAWENSAYAVCPDKLLLPPFNFAYINGQKVSNAADKSILTYLKENTISNAVNGRPLDIVSTKWLTNAGVGNTQRMVAYTNDESRVRFPLVPIQRYTPYYQGISFNAPYVYAFGEVEFVYPETVIYADGI